MNEEKSKERPTNEAGTADVSVGHDEVAGKGSKKHDFGRSVKSEVVTVRMPPELIEDLAYVKQELGARSGPEALRMTLEMAATTLRGHPYQLPKQQEQATTLDISEETILAAAAIMQDMAQARNKMARQLQAIGHNWNQIVRLGKAGGRIPVEAVEGVQRDLRSNEASLAEMTERIDIRLDAILPLADVRPMARLPMRS